MQRARGRGRGRGMPQAYYDPQDDLETFGRRPRRGRSRGLSVRADLDWDLDSYRGGHRTRIGVG